jgi:hypothetical protein
MASTASMPKYAGRVSRPRGDYKLLSTTSGTFEVNDDDVLVTAFFPETQQFVVTDLKLAGKGLAFDLNDENKDNILVRLTKKCDLQNRVTYLYKLLDEFGFRIYAVFVLGVISDEGWFQGFDIYAGVAGEGNFLPTDKVRMFL